MSDRVRPVVGPPPFRLVPPPAGEGPPVRRSRLIETLAGRFERRVTVVQGGAGFGKSTLLAQAIEQNRLAARGMDVWLGCVPADESADHLADGLWAALSLLGDGADDGAPAPADVALILDDVHLVRNGSSGAAYLADLIDSLPTNGHVVLASRHPVPLPLAKRRAAGTAVIVDEGDLAFDAGELDQFVAARGLDPSVVEASAGWPAMVELRAGAGAAVADDFLWEEVLSQIEPERRATGLPELHTDDFGYVLARLPPALLATAQGATIRGYMFLGGDGEAAADAFELAAERFRETGDGHGEARVLSQMLFVRSWNSDREGMLAVLSGLVELAEAGVGAARTGIALSEAYSALVVGDVERAIGVVHSSGRQERPGLRAVAGLILATAQSELGCPELAKREAMMALPHAAGRLRASLEGVRLEAELVMEFPEEAAVRQRLDALEAAVRSYGVAEPLARVLTGFVLVALQYGWPDEARRYLDEGRQVAAGVGRRRVGQGLRRPPAGSSPGSGLPLVAACRLPAGAAGPRGVRRPGVRADVGARP